MAKIRQLEKSEVIPAICNNVEVIRVNINKMIACDLRSKTINTILNDFEKADYIYFTLEEVE